MLRISCTETALVGICKTATPCLETVEHPLLRKTIVELDEYFSGIRTSFSLPIEFQGTEFQKQVWNALLKIPYGCTKSYKDVAMMIGNPKAVRAVGNACNKNKLLIVVPCHRIVGSNGALVGFAVGLDVKQTLLSLETKNL